MPETSNISEIANKISDNIFKFFKWNLNHNHDINFECHNSNHKTSSGGNNKKTHPGDVVFSYKDPYLGKTIYLHTDLKSYGKSSITSSSVRAALKSLCMTVECASQSKDWKSIYSVQSNELHEVRGFLFVYCHDNTYNSDFSSIIEKIDLGNIPVSINNCLHYVGPKDILKLYSISRDIEMYIYRKSVEKYTFYYPDLVKWRRKGGFWDQAASIESILSPYIFIKYKIEGGAEGYLIYYSRRGDTVEEFIYFIDSLSRFQMLGGNEKIEIKVVNNDVSKNLKSNFYAAVKRYSHEWGFDEVRQKRLENICIDSVESLVPNYNVGEIGWRS